jgi:hypothetical protein
MKWLWRLVPRVRELERENAELLRIIEEDTKIFQQHSATLKKTSDALADGLQLVTQQQAMISRLVVGGATLH